jgi:hypothetical protein
MERIPESHVWHLASSSMLRAALHDICAGDWRRLVRLCLAIVPLFACEWFVLWILI